MKLTVKSFSVPYQGQLNIRFGHELHRRGGATPEGVRTMRILHKLVGGYFSYSIRGAYIECAATLPSSCSSAEQLQAALDRDANTKLKVFARDIKVVGGRRGERVAPLANVAELAKLRKRSGGKCNVHATMFINANLPLITTDNDLIRKACLPAEFGGPVQGPPFDMGMSVTLFAVKDDPWRQLRDLMPAIRKLIV